MFKVFPTSPKDLHSMDFGQNLMPSSPLITEFSFYWLPWYFSNTPRILSTQSHCICCSLSLECSCSIYLSTSFRSLSLYSGLIWKVFHLKVISLERPSLIAFSTKAISSLSKIAFSYFECKLYEIRDSVGFCHCQSLAQCLPSKGAWYL